MANVREEGFNACSVEVYHGGFSQEVHSQQHLLADQFGLNIHGLLVVYLEQNLAVAPLSGYYLGSRFGNLFFFQAVNQILQALKILAKVFVLSTSIDDIS